MKHTVIQRIIDQGIIAIIRTDNANTVTGIVDACIAGGITAIEITFTVDGAPSIIHTLNQSHGDSIILGAGTVLDNQTARMAILNGAQYIVSPHFSTEIAALCNRYSVPYIAGCMTPTEIITAMEHGVEVIKLFPAGVVGIPAIKAIMAPFPHAQIIPTGGITLNNAREWIRAGAVALGVGGNLVNSGNTNDLKSITATAQSYCQAIAEARAELL